MDSNRFYTCVVIVSMLKICSGATAIGLSAFNTENENRCIDEETGVRHRLHSTWTMTGQCGKQTCVKFAGQLYIQYETCGHLEFKAEDNCRIVEDATRSYPLCCPSIICDAPQQPDSQNIISNEINIDTLYDDYEYEFMNAMDSAPRVIEDYFLSGDEISEQQHPDETYEPVEYVFDWDSVNFPNFN